MPGGEPTRRALRRGYTRRQFLATGAKVGVAATVAGTLPLQSLIARPAGATGGWPAAGLPSDAQLATLRAAVARLVPADPLTAGDWSALSVGADAYIVKLLAGTDDIYAGGPYRANFGSWRTLSRVKEIGWAEETARLRQAYADGLALLNQRSGGNFAGAPEAIQDAVLQDLDWEGNPFFNALYEHTMEGVYAHPVYGGNKDYRAWQEFCYQGDVHGVRFPGIGDQGASWNVNGGYAPSEMAQPGVCPGQGPTP